PCGRVLPPARDRGAALRDVTTPQALSRLQECLAVLPCRLWRSQAASPACEAAAIEVIHGKAGFAAHR
ncbi:MAG TPA: hypothetical protein PLH95_02720, partial [Thauera aminoaromatica]|nr:hypothetical protein [Thauera aminoaromatica]